MQFLAPFSSASGCSQSISNFANAENFVNLNTAITGVNQKVFETAVWLFFVNELRYLFVLSSCTPILETLLALHFSLIANGILEMYPSRFNHCF